MLRSVALCAPVAMLAGLAPAQQMYATGFPGAALPPELAGFSTSGYRIEVGGGACEIVKDQGVTSGTATVRLCRWVVGDFSVQIAADRSGGAGAASTGLIVWYPRASYANAFFFRDKTIASNIFQSGAGSRTVPSSASAVSFRIRRTGETMTVDFDDGAGWVTLHTSSDAALLGPVQAGFFTVEDSGSALETSFAFDDFSIEAEALAECYADCDCSVSLDFFDFLCFQDSFAGGDPYADCDGSGALDFFDFLCFQNGFAAGCP